MKLDPVMCSIFIGLVMFWSGFAWLVLKFF
jgi:hypothetical protein